MEFDRAEPTLTRERGTERTCFLEKSESEKRQIKALTVVVSEIFFGFFPGMYIVPPSELL